MRRSADELWIVSRVFPPDEGGVQTYARSIARAYVRLGWKVRVFCKTTAGPRRIHEDGFELTDVGDGSKGWVYVKLAWALLWAALLAAMHGRLPAAVHATTWRSALLPMTLRIAPFTVSVHGREIGRPNGTAARWMGRTLASAARVVAVSQWTRQSLLRRLPSLEAHCVVAWNGLSDLATCPELPTDPAASELLVLTACRLVPRKNLQLAIAAAGLCAASGLKFRYLIAGRGPELVSLQRYIDDLRLGDRVQLLGFVSDPHLAALYAQASVFLHPQIELEDGAEMEGFGIAVADAMASGNACIVGVAGGPAELVEDNVTGRIVDGRDLKAIASALEDLLRDPPSALRMGNAAREWARRLSWERHCLAAVGAPRQRSDS